MAPRLSPGIFASLAFAYLATLSSSASAAPDDSTGVAIQGFEPNEAVLAGPEGAKKGWVWADPLTDLAPDAVASEHISNILFVNRCAGGCTIQPGTNDARVNKSMIAKETAVLSEFQWDQQSWDDTIACIRDVYSPYNVEVVTVDPGDEFHHEAILAGTPGELGLDGNIGGIAPSSCTPLNNVISFSFANAGGSQNGDPLTMCWTVAQESAHAFGLPNHVFNCLDPMTYLPGCGKKYFRNQAFPCGEFQEGPCNCSGATQNSHVELRNVFGDGTQPPPPELAVLLPKGDDMVENKFAVYWEASDPRLVSRSELWLNGTKYATIQGNAHSTGSQDKSYNTTVPDLPDGVIDVEIKSYNELGSESIATVTVQKGAPCENADSCFDHQECNVGRCEYPAATAELGDSCAVDQQCTVGVCGQVGDSRACTVTCNPSVGGSCSDGFECITGESGGFVCWTKGEDGGCCSVAGSKGDPLPWFGGGVFLVGLMFLRRRRA